MRASAEEIWSNERGFSTSTVMQDTIALVDDDRNILTSVSIALEAEGFKVRPYNDGAEALRGISASPVDLQVLDIKMPRMRGMELLGPRSEESRVGQVCGSTGRSVRA